jgi:hypothetical protein
MQIRFYADSTRRVVRITDGLYDRLIDLKSGKFVAEDNPPEGKELTSFVREAALPELKRSVEIREDMQLTQPKSASMAVPPNPALRMASPRPCLSVSFLRSALRRTSCECEPK